MRLCKSCGTYPRLLVADRSQPSTQTDKFMFSHPMIELDNCYCCDKKKRGMFDLASEFYRRGNLVNSHNDGNYPKRGDYDGIL